MSLVNVISRGGGVDNESKEVYTTLLQEKEKHGLNVNRSRHCLPGDELGPSQPVAGVIGAAFSGVSIMVANILKLFKVGEHYITHHSVTSSDPKVT